MHCTDYRTLNSNTFDFSRYRKVIESTIRNALCIFICISIYIQHVDVDTFQHSLDGMFVFKLRHGQEFG